MKITIGIVARVIIAAFAVAFVISLLLSGCSQTFEIDEQTADCIAQHSTVYISTGCKHCLSQENSFGPYFINLNIIDCLLDGTACSEADVAAVPTWFIEGQRYEGVLSNDYIRNLTGC